MLPEPDQSGVGTRGLPRLLPLLIQRSQRPQGPTQLDRVGLESPLPRAGSRSARTPRSRNPAGRPKPRWASWFPPYRSNSHKSSFADPGGEGCSYFLGKHRVFTIDATWDQGKTIFGMSAGFSANLAAALGANGPTADTLDGDWDQAGAGPTGNLYFLKGDQMLEISYRLAGVDLAAAVRLAKRAVGRLK